MRFVLGPKHNCSFSKLCVYTSSSEHWRVKVKPAPNPSFLAFPAFAFPEGLEFPACLALSSEAQGFVHQVWGLIAPMSRGQRSPKALLAKVLSQEEARLCASRFLDSAIVVGNRLISRNAKTF